ncbi:MAG TPA: SLBB domain-containing protein [Rhizomicrobium sp.]|jgi:protein involved in polysaccharide export with SLBB domain
MPRKTEKRLRRYVLRCLILMAPVLAVILVPAMSRAQSLSDILGGSGNNVSSDLLRNLQQRLTGQAAVPSLQPGMQIQNPSLFPQQPGLLSGLPMQAAAPANRSMSAIERLMSERAGQPLRQFGYAFFGRSAPVIVRQSGALQDNYVLGQGDEIVLTLRGQENSSFRTRVDRDGRVVLPTLPPIAAAGRSFGAFRADVEAAARRAMPGSQALVSVGEVRQISVRVAGEVNNPGVFYATGLSTAMDALSLAGGVKNTGSLRDIQIIRGARITHLDLYALLAGGAGGTDITLTEGDRVVVPLQTSAVGVVGQVKRPAIYELPPGRSGVPVADLLALAGGPEVRGNYRLSILKTRDDGKREMVQVGTDRNTLVRDGDILFVASNADVSLAKVSLMGSSALDGFYPLSSVRSLHDLLASADMFAPVVGKPLPYLLIGAVIRLDPATMQRTVIAFSPADILEAKADLPLQSNDVVYILNVAEMRYIAHRATAAQQVPAGRVISDNTVSGAQAVAPSTNSALASAVAGTGQPAPEPTSLDNQLATAIAASQNGAGAAAPAAPPVPVSATATQPALAVNPGAGLVDPTYAALAAGQGRTNDETQESGPPKTEAEQLNPGIVAPPDAMETDQKDQASSKMESGMQGQSRAAKRPPLRIFVGLDVDARRLLISTLGNYYASVVGEVNDPGDFLLMPQTGLDKIVQAAGGLTPKVNLHAFEVTSADIDNVSGLSRTVRKNFDLMPDKFTQVALKPFDRVRFNAVFSDRDSGDVSVFGEVQFPGGYEILRGEHLSSVLKRAGGFTGAAYPAGAIFLRRSVAQEEQGAMRREADDLERQVIGLVGTVSNKAQVSQAEIGYVTEMIGKMREGGDQNGRIAVQIVPQQIAAHPELDIVMEPGDRLFIPRRPSSVVVAGEVMAPGGIQFRANRTVDDYLRLAGGITSIADEDHIFVIQPDGAAVQAHSDSWLSESPKLAPGSVIVVPRQLRHFTWDTILEDAVQVTSQIGITAASLAVIANQ